MKIKIRVDTKGIDPLKNGAVKRAIVRALKKAGATALRDMRSEANKTIRSQKRLKVRNIRKALHPRKARGSQIADLEWRLNVSGDVTRVSDYPHRQTKKGVSVAINKGQRTLIRSAFKATMASGHKGVFVRRTKRRLPIAQPVASRPVDALSKRGQAEKVRARGEESFGKAFDRILPLELEKT